MLKNRVFYFLALIFIGLVAYIGFYLGVHNTQQSDQVIKLSVYKPPLVEGINNALPPIKVSDNKTVQTLNEKRAYLSKYQPNQSTLNKLINNAEPYQIEEYLGKWIAKDDLDFDDINDKHTFAKSLVREFLDEQDSVRSYTDAYINFSLSHQVDKESPSSFKLNNSRAPLYAHLQLEGLTTPMDNIFVKWTHEGKVLLFSKKKIDASTEENWVSWVPDENWKIGFYTVIFYQFDKSLTPIATADYYIH